MNEPARQARFTALREDIENIHHANRVYWSLRHRSQDAIAKYENRQEQLQEIRKQMEELAYFKTISKASN